MKDQTNPTSTEFLGKPKELEDQNYCQKECSKCQDDPSNTDSDKDSGFSNDDEIKQSEEGTCCYLDSAREASKKRTDETIRQLRILLSQDDHQNDEEMAQAAKSISAELDAIPKEQRYSWMLARTMEIFNESLPKSLLEIISARFFDGDNGVELDSRPDWLDMEKFRRGQKFAMDHLASIAYADLISLFALYSFHQDLKPIIASGNSSTPYTSFKRYLSTNVRVHNWYKSDPWTPGTAAYKDIKAVRNLHALVRKRTAAMSAEEYAERTRIKEPWCPALSIIRQDFQSSCPVSKSTQRPFGFLNKCQTVNGRFLSQGEMASTQFGFVGLVVLKPTFFGIHYASDRDLEDFLHLWRGIGHLLGIEDRYNFCRGSLEDVRTRCRDFLEYWVKPNFRLVTPEWEHMMRCTMQGIRYYYPGSVYETALLDLADIMNVKMPRLQQSLTFSQWIKRFLIRFYLSFALRFDRCRERFNSVFEKKIERAIKFDEDKHAELQKRSEDTLLAYAMSLQEKESSPSDKPHSE